LLTAGYFSVKIYIFKKINTILTEKIAFSDLNVGIFPPSVRVVNLKNFDIKDHNIVSFKKITLELPLSSLFSKSKKVNLNIHNPTIILNDEILKKKKGAKVTKTPFEIDRINVIDGKVLFDGKKISADLLNFSLSSFNRSGRSMYRLISPHLKVIFPLGSSLVKIEGDMICEFRAQKSSWKISRFLWNTEDLRLKINGRVFKNGSIALNASVQGTPERILYPVLKDLRPQGYLEANAKIRRKKKEAIFVEGDVGYNSFSLGGEVFEFLRGTVKWDSLSKLIDVDVQFNDGPLKASLKVGAKPKLTVVSAENLSVHRITKIIKINKTVPLGGLVRRGDIRVEKGFISGTVRLESGRLSANATGIGDPSLPFPRTNNPLFLLDGEAIFRYHSKRKTVEFSTTNAFSEFGHVKFLEGKSDPHKATSLQIKMAANIDDIAQLNKYTDYYINLDLSPWKLKKGSGTISLDLHKTGRFFFVESDLDMRNFFLSGQIISAMSGHISTDKSLTSGTFRLADDKVTGNVDLFVGKDYFTMDFNDIRGESAKIMKLLELDVSVSGWSHSNVHLMKKNSQKVPLVRGEFTAKQLNFYDFVFDDISGDLEYQDYVALKNLNFKYNGGIGQADVRINYKMETYALDGKIDGININRLHPEFHGLGGVDFKGEGLFNRDPINVSGTAGDVYFYKDRKFNVKGSGKIFTNFSDFRIATEGNILYASGASPFTFKLDLLNNKYGGSFHVNLTDINLLIPWGDNVGSVELDGGISGTGSGELSTEGHAVFKGRVFSFPNFPHALENFNGDIIFKDLNFTLRSLKGTMGGGPVNAGGYLNVEDNKLKDILVSFAGKDMEVYPFDRTSFILDAELSLKYKNSRLLLSGNLDAKSGIWKREVTEGLSFNTDASLSSSGSRLLDMLEFDLKMSGMENLQLDNSLGKATGRFNLRLTGNTDFPIIMGYVDFRKGKINFSDKQFD
ncbi:MAG: hypothetical protein GY765_03660, partial [bacterium]|nr:hypothetical protein [bacterium]